MSEIESISKELFVLLVTVLSIAILEVQVHRLRKEMIYVKVRFWRRIDGK
jgi:hypothetical protein